MFSVWYSESCHPVQSDGNTPYMWSEKVISVSYGNLISPVTLVAVPLFQPHRTDNFGFRRIDSDRRPYSDS